MESDDLNILLQNLDSIQVEVIMGVALRLAEISSDKWSGKITFEIVTNQGGIVDGMRINRGEVVKFGKKRRVRSTL